MKVGVLVMALAALVFAAPATADDWWPHPSGASWEYQWSDSVYAQTPTKEKVVVANQSGSSFTLGWTTAGEANASGAIEGFGTMDFVETPFGVTNTNWSSTAPPASFPVLCPTAQNCGNALSDTLYYLIWGSRVPVIWEPLLKGETWTSTGGQLNDVNSTSTYLGTEQVSVPAFQGPVTAAKIRTDVTQAGALGDPYGSGERTVWWVFGVGPVKLEFQHDGGSDAATSTSELLSTSLMPETTPSDANYFPLTKGRTLRYRWTNTKHLKTPEVEQVTVDANLQQTARFIFRSVSGPIRVAAAYIYSTRLDGVTNTAAVSKAITSLKLPKLGPKGRSAAKRNRFLTPFDLMNFGMNPVLTAYPAAGDTWSVKVPSHDFTQYGVRGSSKIIGIKRIQVPAGTFNALEVRSTLKQKGFSFGSGTRTSWFAPGKGLVKLVFRHADGSVSLVQLLK
ncbi:MAG TPA: hypothetical protein VEH52_08555 [Gaiellaceae bacterium]|nr:hypothetical protein [Gaiellaceae bacterium]